MNIIKYIHHKEEVLVRQDLKGKHREYCLCMICKKFFPGKENNCPIAQEVYNNCVKFHITTPMWECPEYTSKEE